MKLSFVDSKPIGPAPALEKATLGRRCMLQLAAAGAALFYVPALEKEALANLRAGAPAKRVLIVNFAGAMRSSAAFYASTEVRYNPWGLINGSSIPFGAILDDTSAPYVLGTDWQGATAPRFRDLFGTLSVVGSWDDKRGDHLRARYVETSGAEGGSEPGVLVRAYNGLDDALGTGSVTVPPFQVDPISALGTGPGEFSRYSAVGIAGPSGLPSQNAISPGVLSAAGNDWAASDTARGELDTAVSATRSGFARDLADAFAAHRRASRQVGATLAQPWVNVGNTAANFRSATYGKVTLGGSSVDLSNQMLFDLFTAALGIGTDVAANQLTQHPAYDAAINAALSIRLLQMGSPALGLEFGSFDLHSGEKEMGPVLYRFAGRLLSTLAWLLQRMPDPSTPGKSMFDTTMILTITDFGRDPANPQTGFNGGDGSDHGNDPSCYYVAHTVMGAGTIGGRVLAKVDNAGANAFRADIAPERYTIRDVLATTLWAIGLDQANPQWGFPDIGSPIQRLWSA